MTRSASRAAPPLRLASLRGHEPGGSDCNDFIPLMSLEKCQCVKAAALESDGGTGSEDASTLSAIAAGDRAKPVAR